jgi:hypothetical protein
MRQVDFNTFPQPRGGQQAAPLETESLISLTLDRIGGGKIAALAVLMISVSFD